MSKIEYPSLASEFVALMHYCRWLPEEQRRENWEEVIERVLLFLQNDVPVETSVVPDKVWRKIRQGLQKFEVFPSMRLVSVAGTGVDHAAYYNCAYLPMDCIEAFGEVLYLLSLGVGVGFSCEAQYIKELPVVKSASGLPLSTFVIKDSREGWQEAVCHALHCGFEGRSVEFDFSKIRPAGERLKTFGGYSSGSGPIRELLQFIADTMLKASGRQLTPLEVHDINCVIAKSIIAGGKRRSALISFSDLDNMELARCKIHPFPEYRYFSNNSAVFKDENGPNSVDFLTHWQILASSGTGERGIYNLNAVKQMYTASNSRREFSEHMRTNPCFTGDTKVAVADGRGSVSFNDLIKDRVDVPVYCLDDNRKVAVRYMRNIRKTGEKVPVYKLFLDDGSEIRVTKDHKFILNSGKEVELCNLKPGDSLRIATKFVASMREVTHSKKASNSDYLWWTTGAGRNVSDHKLIAEFNNGKVQRGYVIHHKDRNSLNNTASNLEILKKKEHDKVHLDSMLGDNNPMRRAATEWSDEKWANYKHKQSVINSGSKNGNALDVSNEEIYKKGLELTREIKCRFSSGRWIQFAKKNNLPTHFTSYRRKELGSLMEFSKKCASDCGIKHVDLDPRVMRTLNRLEAKGVNFKIKGNKLYIERFCIVCNKSFYTRYCNNPASLCSKVCQKKHISSVGTDNWKKYHRKVVLALQKTHSRNRNVLKIKQIELYNELQFKLKRPLWKKEWQAYCKEKGVSCEMNRSSSSFRYYKDLKEAAANYNHKVVKIEFDGYEDVYNGTVDEFHNYFVGDFHSKTKSNKNKFQYLVVKNCGETVLRPMQFCNLTEVVVRSDDSLDDLISKIKTSVWISMLQSCLIDFKSLRPDWRENAENEKLLGISLTGLLDNLDLVNSETVLTQLRKVVYRTAKQVAKKLNIKEPSAACLLKPSGTVSQLSHASAGLHSRYSSYYVRRYRISKNDPIVKLLRAQGVPLFIENGQTKENLSTYVVEFPVKSPKGAVTRDKWSVDNQVDFYLLLQKSWSDMNCSCTVYVDPVKEWVSTGANVFSKFSDIVGITFFPYSDFKFALAPYEEITKEEYEKRVKEFPDIDFSRLPEYERLTGDTTTVDREFACAGGACDLA